MFEQKLKRLREAIENLPPDASDEIQAMQEELDELESRLMNEPTAWERVQLSRHENRPYTLDYIERLFDGFREIHGDRKYADDKAIVAGMAVFEGEPVMVIGHQKGRNTRDRLFRNYGMPKPEGYRKAIRLMKLAEKFRRPIFTFIDTPGAYPGIGAEERGQAEAIADSLRAMAQIRVPIIATVLGEGGSGGALAIGLADQVLMLQNSIYSVISPESCSAILWKDQDHAREAAESLRLTAPHLLQLGVIDEIVPEPAGGAHADWDRAASLLADCLRKQFQKTRAIDPAALLERRYRKFRRIGGVVDSASS